MSSTIHFLLRKTLLKQINPPFKASIKAHGFSIFLQKPLKHTLETSNLGDPQSVTVSYLRNSCGLSLESAILASQKLQLDTKQHQPDSVLQLLKTAGLDQTHITNLISKRPKLLLADPDKTIKPNIDLFLHCLGLSATDLVKIVNKFPRILETDTRPVVNVLQEYGFTPKQIFKITINHPQLFDLSGQKIIKPKLEYFKSFLAAQTALFLSFDPSILHRSLENQIVPSVEAITRIVGTDGNILKVLKGCVRILRTNPEKVLEPNMALLMNHGVPQSNIVKLIILYPHTLIQPPARFREAVEEVDRLGFDPTRLQNVLAVRSIAMVSKPVWEQKWETFRSFGMSEDEVVTVFKSEPLCLSQSLKKISKVMDFFTNKLKMKPSCISKNSRLLKFSLENRIIPRCAVLQLLMEKDLVKGNISPVSALGMTEKRFLQKYVDCFLDVVPEVISAQQGKIQFTGFPIELS